MSPGRVLYDRYRRHEPDSVHWNWLEQEVRAFWERLARLVRNG